MKIIRRSFLVLLLALSAGIAFAQPVLTTKNLSLGGGGTAYLTGYEANFLNPANLMIRSRSTDFSIGLGETGYLFNPVSPASSIGGQFERFSNYLDAYDPDVQPVTTDQIDQILVRNYKSDGLVSEHQHRLDFVIAGIQWQQNDQALSLTARARIATRIEVGRGWYDETFIERNNPQDRIRDMRLVQQSQYLFEFSFGYAQEFHFVSGLIPRIGQFYIGIAPKFILGGSYLNLDYNGRYLLDEESVQPALVESFSYRSTGNFSKATQTYASTGNATAAIDQNFSSSTFRDNFSDYTEPTGYGGGFDFGLTYILSLGSEVPQGNSGVADKSLRLALSITDIGFISYTEDPFSSVSEEDTVMTQPTTQTPDIFKGSPGQYIAFFDHADASLNPISEIPSAPGQSDNFTTILPTSFNAGMLLEINRLKFAADIILGLNDTAFNNTKLTGHFGLEFSPVEYIPVRLGTRLAAGANTLWSLGTGIERKHWEFSIGARFSTLNVPSSSEFTGAALGGLKFYF